MKIFLLLSLALSVSSATVLAAEPPSKWHDLAPRSRSKLPAEVRERLPAGAETLHLGRLPIGFNGAPMLVHVWTARRVREPNSNHTMDQSPVCVDVFAQGKSFMRTASAVFLSDDVPTEISARWLYASKMRGPVLIMAGPSYISTKYTLVTFPGGVGAEDDPAAFVQDFYQGGVGGGKILQNFGVDEAGVMTVETQNSYAGKVQSNVVSGWNGSRFEAPQEPAN